MLLFSEPIPRKGTETLEHPHPSRPLPLHNRFSEPIPRKGTETNSKVTIHSLDETNGFFRTYSPQGDGNFLDYPATKTHLAGFSEPIPRKGTETAAFT